MSSVLLFLIIGFFVTLLFLNFYFRVKVLKVYKRLVQNEVQFGSSHIFSKKKMETEILPRYPEHKDDILLFVSHINHSIRIASVLIVLITLAGMLLKRTSL